MWNLWQFNWVDSVVLLLVFLYTWQGWERGVYLVWGEFISWLLALIVGLYANTFLSSILVLSLGVSNRSAPMWAFLISVVVLQQFVYRALQTMLQLMPRQYFKGVMHAVLGIMPAFLSGVMVMAFLIVVLSWIPLEYPLKQDVKAGWFANLVHQFLSQHVRL
jgi:uncharacterized membrane protein required for colicin V production